VLGWDMASVPPLPACVLMVPLAGESGPHYQVGQLAQLFQGVEGVGMAALVGPQGGRPAGPVGPAALVRGGRLLRLPPPAQVLLDGPAGGFG